MKDQEEVYESLISIEDIGHYEIEAAIEYLGSLIEVSSHLHKIEGLEKAVKLSSRALKWELSPTQSTLLHHFIADAWGDLKVLRRKEGIKLWDSSQEEVENEIFHLRIALNSDGFDLIPMEMRCQISTDLGDAMVYIGRFVEAIEYWDGALDLNPKSSIALGNRGIGFINYSQVLDDDSQEVLCHRESLLKRAHSDLEIALQSDLDEDARGRFQEYSRWIESTLSPGAINSEALKEDGKLDYSSPGGSAEERCYREWCLKNRLFLNPLNELGTCPAAARDSLAPPKMMAKSNVNSDYLGLFNQLIQEFASARFLFYEGISSVEPHFSDKSQSLFYTPDYPAYSLAIEKVKAAFRTIYSIFDKIATLLDNCLNLGIPERETNFRSLWYRKIKNDHVLRQEFQNNDNWPLRGLFWLSKDLYDERPLFRDFMEPDAKKVHEIRLCIEHKYLRVHQEMVRKSDSSKLSPLSDNLGYSVYRCYFEEKTLKLIKKARAGLIYLMTAINYQEGHLENAQKRRAHGRAFSSTALDDEPLLNRQGRFPTHER